ncbi:ATP-binding cassette domain-containing protein, partial [Bordetella bronchiseptica]
VRRNEIFALLGSSGSGKSTLLRMLAGQTGPDRDAAAHWRDTCVHLPADAPPWRDILTHAGHQGRALALSELLARWPVALCRVQS